MTSVADMTEAQFALHLELVDARDDAHRLSDVALLREARLAGVYGITERDELINVVAKAWVGLA